MSSLVEHFEIPDADANRQVSDCHIEEISNTFCEKWRSLPPYLEMETIVAKDIDRDHPGCDECEKRCSFLKKWKKMRGMKAKPLLVPLCPTCQKTPDTEGMLKLMSLFYHMHARLHVHRLYVHNYGAFSAHFNYNNDRGRYNRAGVHSSKKWTSTAQVH